ncbi:MAG: hypothetical protein ABGX05_20020 [Pirellulaceae bacterium]
MRSLPVIVQVGKPLQGVQSVRQPIRQRVTCQFYRRSPCQFILPVHRAVAGQPLDDHQTVYRVGKIYKDYPIPLRFT